MMKADRVILVQMMNLFSWKVQGRVVEGRNGQPA